MRPHDDIRNGVDKGAGSVSGSSSGSGSRSRSGSEGEGGASEDEVSLVDPEAPARVLASLNALRKSRQHYDVLLVADGAEVPVHRAVLAAVSPYLFDELKLLVGAPPMYRVEGVSGEALRELVEYAYTGRLRVHCGAAAQRLYECAWRLRVGRLRAQLAARLLRTLEPSRCLALRALPDLAPEQLHAVDRYIASHFEEICASGALSSLPAVQICMLRDSSAEDGEEAPLALADAALAWLRDRQRPDATLDELCSRSHLVYVDAGGELRDCGELPASSGEAPELGQYRRDAAQRRARPARSAPITPVAPLNRTGKNGSEWGVITAQAAGGGARALLVVRGQLVAVLLSWSGAGGNMPRGAVLGSARGVAVEEGDDRRAGMSEPRCALGAAAVDGRLIVCGGYDRARVLTSVEAYDPASNTWTALPAMRRARARFPAAALHGVLYVLGGSDGQDELDSVDAFEDGEWKAKARLPLARSHAGAAADEASAALYVAGGWAGGRSLRRVDKYAPHTNWSAAPPLTAGRSQCALVLWERYLWALGGCDTWHCLATTERLNLADAETDWQWEAGPSLPTARRSVGGVVWRGRLVSAGGSDGSASLRRVDWLLAPAPRDNTHAAPPAWSPGPSLRRARAALALQPINDVLYAVGGFDGKEFLSCMECLYHPDGEWTTLCNPPAPRTAPHPAAPPPPTPTTTTTTTTAADDNNSEAH